MRTYYAVEIITDYEMMNEYWVEVELCQTLAQAEKYFNEWIKDLKGVHEKYNVRISKKENLKQFK